jgi:hypothetical protein
VTVPGGTNDPTVKARVLSTNYRGGETHHRQQTTTYSSSTHVLCFAIVLHLSGDIFPVKDWCGLLVLLNHRSMFYRRLGLILPVLAFAFGLLLSEGGNIFPKQPQTQGTNQQIQDALVDPAEKKDLTDLLVFLSIIRPSDMPDFHIGTTRSWLRLVR